MRALLLGGTQVDTQPTVYDEPVLYIDTPGQTPVTSKVDYLFARYRLINERGTGAVLSESAGRIRGRGNSTWVFPPKKPYKVKLDDKTSFFSLPSSKDWALLANYYDTSMVRNAVAYDMARHTTLAWAPRSGYCEVVLNGTYVGLYQFTESVEVDTARVNITKIAATSTTGKNLTGGYLLEMDQTWETSDKPGFFTRIGHVPIMADTPDLTVTEQFSYVKTTIQAFEDVLYSAGFADPTTGYRSLIDLNSWIDWYLLCEVTANNDAGFGSSVRITKNKDGVSTIAPLVMGPPWDFDLSFGLGAPWGIHPTDEWWVRLGAVWIVRMLEDPYFAAQVVARWNVLKPLWETSVPAQFASMAADLADPIARDAVKWPRTTTYDPAAWFTSRVAWLDGQFNGTHDTTPPAAPTGVTYADQGADLLVSWGKPTPRLPIDNAKPDVNAPTGYRVLIAGQICAMTQYPYAQTAGEFYQVVAIGKAGATSVQVQARDQYGNWSA